MEISENLNQKLICGDQCIHIPNKIHHLDFSKLIQDEIREVMVNLKGLSITLDTSDSLKI